MSSSRSQTLSILADAYWGRLSPVQQSTSLADTLLGNVFEPLVDADPRGGIVAGVADRWEVSEDDRTIRFHIRDGVKFSDGSLLDASGYARSLLSSVTQSDRDSQHPNSLDVLYRLKGFSISNAEKGAVAGLSVEGSFLVFEFEKPFRTAIFELTGTRYAAWKRDKDENWLGTGPYRIFKHVENKLIEYEPNPFGWRVAKYKRVTVIGTEVGLEEACKGPEYDIYLGFKVPELGSEAERLCNKSGAEFLGGAYAGHFSIGLNGLEGKLFSNNKFRQAIQFAIHQVSADVIGRNFDSRRITRDIQFYPPLWPGRLDETSANEIVNEGREYLSDLIAATKRSPILLFSAREGYAGLQTGLEKLGLQFKHPYRVETSNATIDAMYGRIDYDMNIHGAMVVGSDPDGLYHLLGQNGALASKQTSRNGVHDALEHGRSLKRKDNLDDAYKKVSEQILREVPEIHLSYLRGGYFYFKNLVEPKSSALNSDRFQFDLFERAN